jgi:hypothetical protein
MTRANAILALVSIMLLGIAAAALVAHGRARAASSARPDAPPATRPAASAPLEVPSTPAVPPPESEADKRARLDRTVWAKEVQAQEHEATFVKLWDDMRARLDDQQVVLAAFPFASLSFKRFAAPVRHRYIDVATMAGDAESLDHAGWEALVADLVARGYRLEHSEWHHAAFDIDPDGRARSRMNMKLYITRESTKERMMVYGGLGLVWGAQRDAKGRYVVESVDATGLSCTSRTGEVAFKEAFRAAPEELRIPSGVSAHPVLVHDLDGDGRDDVIIPSWNLAFINTSKPGTISFSPRPLCAHPLHVGNRGIPMIRGALLADVTGDGIDDLVVAGKWLPLAVFVGAADGSFPDPPVLDTDVPAEQFANPYCVTAGDVDGDGRLDLWIGQYPLVGSPLANPYWDANDGPPAFLLINHGNGSFRDASAGSGLEAKRHRRTYSGSLIDLDGDGAPDLVTVNDYCGVELFHNRGERGKATFEDVTDQLGDDRHTFGMSHAFADFDGDGTLDLFVAGMASTTARRLEYMKLGRDDFPDHQRMRMKMGYGNRMYLGGADHRFKQAPFNDTIARTGWSWGSAAIDVANAGWPDLYVANGFLSRGTARDYCTRWWTQDIYTASEPKRADTLEAMIAGRQGYSWNPFEHKALLVNDGGTGFIDAAFPMGLGQEWDGRAVIAADFDGDGRMDVLTVEERRSDYLDVDPDPAPVLHIFRNQMEGTGHWLDVLVKQAPGRAVLGARVTVSAGGRERPAVVVSGESLMSQSPVRRHFGLGEVDHVDAVVVRWPDGAERRIEAPAIDGTVAVDPPPARQ